MLSPLTHAHDDMVSLPGLSPRDLFRAPRRSDFAATMERVFYVTLAVLLVVVSASSVGMLLDPSSTPAAIAARAACALSPPC